MHPSAFRPVFVVVFVKEQSNRDYGDKSAHGRRQRVTEVLYALNGLVTAKCRKLHTQAGDLLSFGNALRDFTPYEFIMNVFF